jgi:hypothetical protein
LKRQYPKGGTLQNFTIDLEAKSTPSTGVLSFGPNDRKRVSSALVKAAMDEILRMEVQKKQLVNNLKIGVSFTKQMYPKGPWYEKSPGRRRRGKPRR